MLKMLKMLMFAQFDYKSFWKKIFPGIQTQIYEKFFQIYKKFFHFFPDI